MNVKNLRYGPPPPPRRRRPQRPPPSPFLVVLVFFFFRKSNAHTHILDWWAFALDGVFIAKSILPYISSPRGVAIPVPFPEVRSQKGTESGLVKNVKKQRTDKAFLGWALREKGKALELGLGQPNFP